LLTTLDGSDTAPRIWRFVELAKDIVCHVHIIQLDVGWGIALLDARAEHAEQQNRQQFAHELALLQREREAMIEALDQANRLKSEFIARMSHEFRTPLTSVLGYSDQLRELRPDDPEVQRHMDAVGRGAQHLMHLIENLLDQARIEVGQLKLNPSGCDLQELSTEVEQLLQPVARQKQLSLAWWFEGEMPPRVWLDVTRLKQVLINLVGNAIKFTQQGGVNVEFQWHDERLQVSVADTGPGISDADAQKIFEPFRQLAGAGHTKGAGLGLTISQALVQAMGGKIALGTNNGQGARFLFRIDAPVIQQGRRQSAKPLNGSKILVSDDDVDLLELFRLSLSSAGCQVHTARNAAETLEKAHREQPDAVLLDLNLGDDDGASLANRLRANGFQKTIVLLSATSPGDVGYAANDAQVDARWTKPISRNQLIHELAGLIR